MSSGPGSNAHLVGKIPNLWPDDFGMPERVTPKAILNRQGMVVTEKSGGRVRGEVTTKVIGREFVHTLTLVAPELDGFAHLTIQARHPADRFYPVRVALNERDQFADGCMDEAQFLDRVRAVLHDERTRAMLRSLIAQSG